MKNIKLIILVFTIAFGLVSFNTLSESSKYKCMIQMTNYTGEGAYIVISLLNPEGEYVETLNVIGDDDEWYNTIESWWDFYGKKRNDIDAITGATVSGGQRTINVIEIDNDKLDKGYKLRFESAVEDQEYYESDVELELTSANVKSKVEGKGFIRYIRMMPQ
ncbi:MULTISPECIES: DUF2271 domain-containing protein [Winogradskyella]|uniref:DUF2271 domain-containing protein n=1 Tax=Winogradskyella TaxID=286104 RepID=UPI0015C88EF5|nr:MULTISPECIES: DUF2271 domain-containing protein [Winogradskyella]QXP79511.1 DUF2271 domain-containing protein [Winogradskyella sp. HaHa_3_26]